jgi:hypothetical protein
MCYEAFPNLYKRLHTHCQGVRPAQIRKGATQAVVGGLMRGSGPKSISGSSRMNSGLGKYGKDTGILDWFRPLESKSLRLVWWNYVEEVTSPRMEL